MTKTWWFMCMDLSVYQPRKYYLLCNNCSIVQLRYSTIIKRIPHSSGSANSSLKHSNKLLVWYF